MAHLSPLFPEFLQSSVAETRSDVGLLPSQRIHELVRDGLIQAHCSVTDQQIQPASLDLRIGSTAFRVHASFLPGKHSTVQSKLVEFALHELDLSIPTPLERGGVYLLPLLESLSLPNGISARANAKSTIGRLDVFTRLITDYALQFDRVPPGYRGPLYVEVVPRTFGIVVRAGDRLNQLRFLRGLPSSSDRQLGRLDKSETLAYIDDQPAKADISEGLRLSIDLAGHGESAVVGYVARRHSGFVDVCRVNHYDPADFWQPVIRPKRGRLVLDLDEFYILASRERVRIPPTHAAEMVAYDPSMGEFRVHYAGFFDPGFGYGNDDVRGARAVLEIRSHEVPFCLEDRQTVGRLRYEPLVERSEITYGASIGSSYQGQDLMLSKQFRR